MTNASPNVAFDSDFDALPLLEAALTYARYGWRVFPLIPGDKRPLTGHGCKDATTDAARVRAWWTQTPDANIGLATGSASNLFVIDVDRYHPDCPFDRDLAVFVQSPLTATSAHGGTHAYFAYPAPVTTGGAGLTVASGKPFPHWDYRGEGGYIVAPPSRLADCETPYRWTTPLPPEGEPPALSPPCYGYLSGVAKANQPRGKRTAENSDGRSLLPPPSDDDLDHAGAYWLEQAKERCAEGVRNETGLWLACQLRDSRFGEAAAEDVLLDYHAYATTIGSSPYTEEEALGSLRQAYGRTPREPATLSGDLDTDPEPPDADLDGEHEPLLGTCLADVETKEVRWLWPGRIPLGMLTTLDGDPSTAKTMLTITLAALVSRGEFFPDGALAPLGSVILISLEDDLAVTIRPRLEAAGADLSRIISLANVPYRDTEGNRQERPFLLPNDLPVLRKAIEQRQAKLVVIDPVLAALNGKVNSHIDQDVRTQVLTPLKVLAEQTGCAVVLIRHLNKGNSDNALYRGGGSIGWIGAARTGLMAAFDPDDESRQRRVLATVKSNIAQMPPSLTYRIITAPNSQGIGMVEWLGTSDYTAQGLVAAERQKDREKGHLGDRNRAVLDFLRARRGVCVTAAQVAKALDLDDEQAKKALNRLMQYGHIERVGRGSFFLPGLAAPGPGLQPATATVKVAPDPYPVTSATSATSATFAPNGPPTSHPPIGATSATSATFADRAASGVGADGTDGADVPEVSLVAEVPLVPPLRPSADADDDDDDDDYPAAA